MSKVAILFFGSNYRWIFSPIIMLLGVMILFKRASWSISRLVGIILFFIATTSIVGSSSSLIAMIVLWFVAIYLTLRISYRTLLSKVRGSVPSLTRMRDAIIPSDDEDDIVPVKK